MQTAPAIISDDKELRKRFRAFVHEFVPKGWGPAIPYLFFGFIDRAPPELLLRMKERILEVFTA